MRTVWFLLLACSNAAPLAIPIRPPAPPACAPRLATPPPTDTSDVVVLVEKGTRRIGVYRDHQLISDDAGPLCMPAGLAVDAPTGPKRREGDRKTPEGWYRLSDKPTSRYAGAIAVHYPNADDVAEGLAQGALAWWQAAQLLESLRQGHKPAQNTALGGEILFHGGGATDWTLGCIALDDPDLKRLRAALGRGQRGWTLILP